MSEGAEGLERPCAFCREDIPARAAICPRCREPQPVPAARGSELLGWALIGAALALAATALGLRLLELAEPRAGAGPQAGGSLVEPMAVASFLMLAGLALRRS